MLFKIFIKTYFNRAGRISKNDIKKTFKKLSPIVSVFNPIAGIALGGLGGGKEGLTSALKTSLISNITMGNNIFNLSASGKFPAARDLITKSIQNPQKILMNTITSGGDVSQGLLKTVMQDGGNVSKELQAAITGDFGGMMISDLLQGGGGFNLNDPMTMAMLYEAYKTEPPKPPTLPELERIPDEEVFRRLDMFKADLDEATQERINIAESRFASRGIRGSMVDREIRLISKDRDFQMQRAEMEVRDQQLKYNNAVATERYAMQVNNYQLQAKAQKDKMDALTNTVALIQSKGNVLGNTASNFKNIVTDMGRSLGLVKDVGDKQFFIDENSGTSIDIDSGVFGGQGYSNGWWGSYDTTQQYIPQTGLNTNNDLNIPTI